MDTPDPSDVKQIAVLITKVTELTRQCNLLKDQNDDLNRELAAIRAGSDSQLNAAQAKMTNIDLLFKDQYAQRVSILDSREAKIIADEAIIDQKNVDLAAKEKDLNVCILKANDDAKELLAKNQSITQANRDILQRIDEGHAEIHDAQSKLSSDKAAMAQAQADLDAKSKYLDDRQGRVQKMLEQAQDAQQAANQANQSAQDKVDQANTVYANNQTILHQIDQASADNQKQLKAIADAQQSLDSTKASMDDKLAEQNANLLTLQKISEDQRVQAIALQSKEIALNQMQQSLRVRETNVKQLEANISI